jgi:xylulose-5-phosphate/fructose-6-phosphate phosphoketolase
MTNSSPPDGDHLSPDGRVIEMLIEHICEGLLEGYLLTGRHGPFNCYEAFIHIVNSMFNQHAKWLELAEDPVAAADLFAQLSVDLACLAPGP